MKAILELNGMHFFAYHGCLEKERLEGNDFVVDFKAVADISAAAESDSLSDTVDYSRIYDLIAEQMSRPSNLLEHVAARCLDAVCAEFPALEDVRVRISKKNPPVSGEVDSSSITVCR